MIRRVKRTFLFISLLGLLVVNAFVLTAHSSAVAKPKTKYMAGTLDGAICNCPVTVGDCVCAIHTN